MSDDRWLSVLQYLAILLFVCAGVLPLARSRYPVAKWARRGAVMIFSLAVLYAVILVLRWAFSSTH